jgi:uncharacterized protein (DUF1919 family)
MNPLTFLIRRLEIVTLYVKSKDSQIFIYRNIDYYLDQDLSLPAKKILEISGVTVP